MFDELDQLKTLTKNIGITDDEDVETPKEEEDIDGIYVQPDGWGNDGNGMITKIQGSSGSKNANGEEPKPILEEPQADEEQLTVDEAMGLGLGLGRTFKRGLRECNCGTGCDCQFNVGDPVKMINGTKPVILIVRNVDGDKITASIPTDKERKAGTSCVWPNEIFDQDELEPMTSVELNDIDDLKNVISFNDSGSTLPFGGTTIDESPMKLAQETASDNQFERVADFFNEIFGPISYQDASRGANGTGKCYTACSPAVVMQNPDGSITTTQEGYKVKFGD